MTRPILLDLYCGAGGASAGYVRAGFDVVGVDKEPMPHYPYEFYQFDALEFLDYLLTGWRAGIHEYGIDDFVAIHASPPCQRWSKASRCRPGLRDKYPALIEPTRERLRKTGLPYVIENVSGAPLDDPVELCGCQFGLTTEYRETNLMVYRPRYFEANFPIWQLDHKSHGLPALDVFGHGSQGSFYRRFGFGVPAGIIRQTMGCEWMCGWDELAEAIPPVFTEHVGRCLMAYLDLRDYLQSDGNKSGLRLAS